VVTNIPQLLKRQGRTVQWFCREVGIHRSYYHMMETGKRPLSTSYLERAAEILGEPVSILSTSRNTLAIVGDTAAELEARVA